MMTERFEAIFEEVQTELDLDWWELFDSNKFDIVLNRIEAEFGPEVFDSDEFCKWESEMAEDL